ncbi:MAG: hypothetical protein Fur0020_02510 [Thermodesulfovibrionia bacterium]
MENYLPVKVYAKEVNQNEAILQRLFSLFPKEDIYFELTNNGLIVHLRELDFFSFKRNIQSLAKKSNGDTAKLLNSILYNIEKIKSYGLKGRKRLYVGYNRERKVKNREEKEKIRGIYFYAQGHNFSKQNNKAPEQFINMQSVKTVSKTKSQLKSDLEEEIFSGIKKLDINYNRTCNCPSSHINCLTPKEWVKGQVAIWELYYEKRDIRDKDIHPAVFPIALPKKCIELFTHKGELVLDPFVGIGTTLIASRDLGRNAIGFDLNPKYIDFTNERLKESNLLLFKEGTKQIAICDDAINIPKYLKNETVALCVTSPPYANMLNHERLNKSLRSDLRNNKHYKKIQQYSSNPRDLGTMKIKEYINALAEIYKGILPLLRPKAHCVINVNDLWENNHRYPTHSYIIEAMERVGYELRNIIIWDKRNLVNKVGIFGYPSNYITLSTTFEYILDFWKV